MITSYKYIALLTIILFLFQSKIVAQNIATSVMNVSVEVVPGSLLFDQLTRNIEATSSSQNFQIGFKEFTISFPVESEVITGGVTSKNHLCNSYMVANIEKLNDHTGKVKIHYLVGKKDAQEQNQATEKHTATIIYL